MKACAAPIGDFWPIEKRDIRQGKPRLADTWLAYIQGKPDW
jgi:hypothetical protein